MKTKHIIINVFCIMIVALMVVSPVAAKTEIIESKGYIVSYETISEGTWTFKDGNAQVRGMITAFYVVFEDSRFNGIHVVEDNINFGKDGTGPLWGTLTIYGDDGTFCEASIEGMVSDPPKPPHHAVGNCTGNYQKVWINLYSYEDIYGRFLMTKP